MVVGVCKITLTIDAVFSLKEKRHIIKSLIERVQSRFNASAAEVDLNDRWQRSVIGISCVSNDTSHADSMLNKIIDFVENDGRVMVTDCFTDFASYNDE
jgi:uncharacterized protein YlxP (DUF503 family)